MRRLVSCFIIILFVSCKKDPPLYEINNLNGNQISVYGHAGMGIAFKYPIDTYESVEPVLRIGADGTEIDLQLTSDSVLVVFHDNFLEERTTCATGIINDKLWNDISDCVIASPYSNNIKLVSLNELLSKLIISGKNIHDYTFTFDCKLYTNTTNQNNYLNQFANAIIKSINDYSLAENVFIESTDTTFLRILQNKRNDLKLFIYPNNFEEGLNIAQTMNLHGITINTNTISKEQIKIAHDNGIRITLWGLSTNNDNIDAIYKSPDFVQTDKPIHLLKVFGKYK